MTNYPKQRSKVTVLKRDGEVVTYEVAAGPGIARYLCAQAGETGFLTLMCGNRAVNIPVAVIDTWEIELIKSYGDALQEAFDKFADKDSDGSSET